MLVLRYLVTTRTFIRHYMLIRHTRVLLVLSDWKFVVNSFGKGRKLCFSKASQPLALCQLNLSQSSSYVNETEKQKFSQPFGNCHLVAKFWTKNLTYLLLVEDDVKLFLGLLSLILQVILFKKRTNLKISHNQNTINIVTNFVKTAKIFWEISKMIIKNERILNLSWKKHTCNYE